MTSLVNSAEIEARRELVYNAFRDVEKRSYKGKVEGVNFTDVVPIKRNENGLEVCGPLGNSHYGKILWTGDTIIGVKASFFHGDNGKVAEAEASTWDGGPRRIHEIVKRLDKAFAPIEFIVGRPKLNTGETDGPPQNARGQKRERKKLTTLARFSKSRVIDADRPDDEARGPPQGSKRVRRRKSSGEEDADSEWGEDLVSRATSGQAKRHSTRLAGRLKRSSANGASHNSFQNPVDLLSDEESGKESLIVTLTSGIEEDGSQLEAEGSRGFEVIDNPKIDVHRMVEFRPLDSFRGFAGMLVRVNKPKELLDEPRKHRRRARKRALPVTYEIAFGWGTAYISGTCSKEQLFDLTKNAGANPDVARYPKKDTKRAITVRYSDYLRLNGDMYLNDTIVETYLNYLKWDVVPRAMLEATTMDEKRSEDDLDSGLEGCRKTLGEAVHIFSPFFYEHLKQAMDPLEEGSRAKVQPGSESYKKEAEAIERLKRWHRGVNLLDRQLLLIPVCEALHWYLVAVFFPGRAMHARRTRFQLDDLEQELEVLRANIRDETEKPSKLPISSSPKSKEPSTFSMRVKSVCEESEAEVRIIDPRRQESKEEKPSPVDDNVMDLVSASPEPVKKPSPEYHISRRPKSERGFLSVSSKRGSLENCHGRIGDSASGRAAPPFAQRSKTSSSRPEDLIMRRMQEAELTRVRIGRQLGGDRTPVVQRDNRRDWASKGDNRRGHGILDSVSAHLSASGQNKTTQLLKSFNRPTSMKTSQRTGSAEPLRVPSDSLQQLRSPPGHLGRPGGQEVGHLVERVYGKTGPAARERIQKAKEDHENRNRRADRWNSRSQTADPVPPPESHHRISLGTIELQSSSDDDDDEVVYLHGETIGGGGNRTSEAEPIDLGITDPSLPAVVVQDDRSTDSLVTGLNPQEASLKDFERVEERLGLQKELVSAPAAGVAVFDSLNGVSPLRSASLVRRYLNMLYRHDDSEDGFRRECENADDERVVSMVETGASTVKISGFKRKRMLASWPFEASNMPAYKAAVPPQPNDTDCGCYVLMCARKLLHRGVHSGEPKLCFREFTLEAHKAALKPLGINHEWFSKKDVAGLTEEMKRLLYSLEREQQQTGAEEAKSDTGETSQAMNLEGQSNAEETARGIGEKTFLERKVDTSTNGSDGVEPEPSEGLRVFDHSGFGAACLEGHSAPNGLVVRCERPEEESEQFVLLRESNSSSVYEAATVEEEGGVPYLDY